MLYNIISGAYIAITVKYNNKYEVLGFGALGLLGFWGFGVLGFEKPQNPKTPIT